MKTCLLALLCLIAFGASSAFAQTYHAPINKKQQQHVRPAPPIKQQVEVDGVIPRAVRGGNLLQMFNPKAPAKYGTSQEAVSMDPDDPKQWRGLKFFVFRF